MNPPATDDDGVGDGLVLVGTSTGGPPALEALLTPLPANFPWPILVAQHMPASFTGPLAKRLDGLCALSGVNEVLQANVAVAGAMSISVAATPTLPSPGARATGLVVMAAPAQARLSPAPQHGSSPVRSAMQEVTCRPSTYWRADDGHGL